MKSKANNVPALVLAATVALATASCDRPSGQAAQADTPPVAPSVPKAAPATTEPAKAKVVVKTNQETYRKLLGATRDEVRRTLGAPTDTIDDPYLDGTRVHDSSWTYSPSGSRGVLIVHFNYGRVVEAIWTEAGKTQRVP